MRENEKLIHSISSTVVGALRSCQLLRMPFINNTECSFFELLPSIDQPQVACVTSVRVWLIAHFFMTLVALCLLAFMFVWSVYLLAYLLYPHVRALTDAIDSNVRLSSYGNARNVSYACALLCRDVFIVLLCEYLRSIRSGHRSGIGNQQFWILEATNVLPFSECKKCSTSCLTRSKPITSCWYS